MNPLQISSHHNKWTRALWDPSAGVESYKECVALVDVHGGDEHQLLLVDESDGWPKTRLRLYKGLKVEVDQALAEPPTALVGFRSDTATITSSSAASTGTVGAHSAPSLVAVASGGSLLIYRNMKPYYRYNLPAQADLLPAEVELWAQIARGSLKFEQLLEGINQLRVQHSAKQLSFQAQELLSLMGNHEMQTQFVEHIRQKLVDAMADRSFSASSATNNSGVLSNLSITCLATMPRNTATRVDVLVVGTEQASVYFIDTQAYTVLRRDVLPPHHTPFKMLALGQFDIEYRLVVVTRECEVWLLRRSAKGKNSQHSVYIREMAFDVVAIGQQQLVFATRRRKLIFFSPKGKRQNALEFDEDIADIEPFSYDAKQYSGLLVAVGCDLRLYSADMALVDIIRIVDLPFDWVKSGRLGREEGVLVIATRGGGLCVKIFRRVASMDPSKLAVEDTQLRQRVRPIEVPRKSRTFMEVGLRERENPKLIHQIHQRDWFMLRLHTARTFAKVISGETQLLPIGSDAAPVQVTYDLLGFGPRFKLVVRVVATGKLPPPPTAKLKPAVVKSSNSANGGEGGYDDGDDDVDYTYRLLLLFLFNQEEYELDREVLSLPMRMPVGKWYEYAVRVRALHPEKQLLDEEAEARVMLVRQGASRPLWATTLVMPQSEPELL